MSEVQTIQATKENSSSSSKKDKQAAIEIEGEPKGFKMFPEEPVKANAPREGRTEVIVDPKNITKMSGEVHTDSLKLAGQLMELETNVNYCKAAKIEWLEVSPELLKHFNKGKIPDVGYSIYKDIKICLVDTAEEIARREKMDCHQILFPQEGYMKVRY